MRALRQFRHTAFRSLRHRNLRLFITGQAVSQVGYWLRIVAMTLLVYELTDSGTALGLLAAAQFGPILLLGQLGGLVADRSDKRARLLLLQVVGSCISAALAVMAFAGPSQVGWIYTLAVLSGTTMAFEQPMRRSFIGELAPPEDLHSAIGLNTALTQTSRTFGPALAGLLITTVGYGWCFTLDAVSFLAVVAGLLMMRADELRPQVRTPRGKGQVREGLRYVRRTPELFGPMVMSAVVGTLSFNLPTVLPLLATRALDGSDTSYTLLYSAISVGSVIGSLYVAGRSDATVRLVAQAALGIGTALGLLALAPNLPAALAIGCLVGFWNINFFNTTSAIIYLRAEPEMRGRVLALHIVMFMGSTPIGGPIIGSVSQMFGARVGVGIGALAGLGAGVWGLAASRRSVVAYAGDARSTGGLR